PAAPPAAPARPLGGAAARAPASRSVAVPAVAFTARSVGLGIDAVYRNGAEADHCSILESLGGGAGWIDYDRDGWLDLVATGGGDITADRRILGRPAVLYRSQGGRAFREVAATAGIAADGLYSHGVAVGDHDNDGFPDLLVTGYGVPLFFRNQGDGTFAAAPSPAGDDGRWSSSAGWADLDGDGVLDLYLARYVDWSFANHPVCGPKATVRDVCPPRSFSGLADSLYLGDGAGGFREDSAAAGLRADGKGLGVLLADLDVDGDVDIYVANDTTDNFLYINDGRARFEENGLVSGTALDDQGVPNGSMGIDLCDFNRDGLPDLWVTNFEREWFALYRNEGRGNFLHVSRRYGITDIGGLFVGFGTVCDDFDADGHVDIAVTDGHVVKFPDASPLLQDPLYLHFDGDRFRRAPAAAGSYFAGPHMGRGMAAGDYDRDGDLDLAVSHVGEPLEVLENRATSAGRSVLVRLVGTRSSRDAVGARVEVVGVEPAPSLQVTGGASYLSHSDRRLHVVLPTGGGAARLRVRWPAGGVEEAAIPADATEITLVEGAADGFHPDASQEARR
ncbi:MAG: CRTAC1 family protein, partial [Planctomycetaceae bacterium]